MAKRKTVEDRMAQVIKLDNGCWEWQGYVAPKSGYGNLAQRRNGKSVTLLAHRYFYAELVGPIPDGMQLDHTCHNNDPECFAGSECRHRRCVNPTHLDPVPALQNVLRGKGLAKLNAEKTHCPQDHPYTEENTYIEPSGGRQCLACRKVTQKRHYDSAGGDKKREYARERMRRLRADPAYKEYKNARERERYQRNKMKASA